MARKNKFQEKDFISIPLEDLRLDELRPFPIFLYLMRNDHLLLLRKENQLLEKEPLNRYKKLGVLNFWCPTSFKDKWESYKKGELRTESPEEELVITEEEIVETARSEESALAVDVLQTSELDHDEKREILSQISQDLIGNLYNLVSDDPDEVKQSIQKCKEFAEDIVKVALRVGKLKNIWAEIEAIQKAVGLEHSTLVSSFSVIFGMGIGITDPKLLANLSLAGLMHDIGFVKLEYSLLSASEHSFTPDQKIEFEKHVDLGIKIIKEQKIDVPEEVIELIYQHHEHFDGTGYPNGIKGFEINEFAQILSIADQLDDLMTGRLDGKERGPKEAMDILLGQQEDNTKHQLFDPDLFYRVMHLINKQSKNDAA